MEKDRSDQYIKALKAKGVDAPCPRCGRGRFDIVGDSYMSIQEKPNVVSLGGPSVPVVLVACVHCGYLTMHVQQCLNMKRGDKNG